MLTYRREIYGYPDNVWFVSLFDATPDAVRVLIKLNIRTYVSDVSLEGIRVELRDVTD